MASLTDELLQMLTITPQLTALVCVLLLVVSTFAMCHCAEFINVVSAFASCVLAPRAPTTGLTLSVA